MEARQVNPEAIPAPERYSLSGRLCRPRLEKHGTPEVKDYFLLLDREVLIDKQVLTFLAEVARRHGFPRLRLTVEVLDGE